MSEDPPGRTITDIHDDITNLGWAALGVPDEPGRTGYLYTVGLTAQGHPELLIEGDPHRTKPYLDALVEHLHAHPDRYRRYAEIELRTASGEPFTAHITGPTKRDHLRAAYARHLYSDTHPMRVLHARLDTAPTP